MLYFLILPLLIIITGIRCKKLAGSIKEKNTSKIKAELVFLLLTFFVITITIAAIELKN
jgi:hypothetical protein